MKKLILALMLFPFSMLSGQQQSVSKMADKTKPTEEMIRNLDDEERRAALDRNVSALERLWSEDFTVNAPNNAVSTGKKAVMETFIKSGIINFSSYERKIEFIRIDGNYAFVFGLEILIPKTDAPSAGLVAGQTVNRRYTNIWKNEKGRWRLFARHANVIPQTSNQRQMPKEQSTKSTDNSFFSLATAKWSEPYEGPPGFPKGAQRATVSTDAATGGETYYARFPAGSRFELHWHAHAEYAVVLRGKVTHFLGDQVQSLNVGDYVIIPAQTNHGWQVAPGEDAFLLIRRDGAADFNFIGK
ncbi:MAG: DUF4440 domain-containing protein [Pyrinomonadaceae bacterium]|nr:DUF4440 domain-containing protein [Pyrinomonadaceae bacterium]